MEPDRYRRRNGKDDWHKNNAQCIRFLEIERYVRKWLDKNTTSNLSNALQSYKTHASQSSNEVDLWREFGIQKIHSHIIQSTKS